VDDAGAALAGVATDMGAGQVQVFAEELNEQGAGFDLARHLLAVHRHGNRGHALISLVKRAIRIVSVSGY
jgi:hypothetical protein